VLKFYSMIRRKDHEIYVSAGKLLNVSTLWFPLFAASIVYCHRSILVEDRFGDLVGQHELLSNNREFSCNLCYYFGLPT